MIKIIPCTPYFRPLPGVAAFSVVVHGGGGMAPAVGLGPLYAGQFFVVAK